MIRHVDGTVQRRVRRCVMCAALAVEPADHARHVADGGDAPQRRDHAAERIVHVDARVIDRERAHAAIADDLALRGNPARHLFACDAPAAVDRRCTCRSRRCSAPMTAAASTASRSAGGAFIDVDVRKRQQRGFGLGEHQRDRRLVLGAARRLLVAAAETQGRPGDAERTDMRRRRGNRGRICAQANQRGSLGHFRRRASPAKVRSALRSHRGADARSCRPRADRARRSGDTTSPLRGRWPTRPALLASMR